MVLSSAVHTLLNSWTPKGWQTSLGESGFVQTCTQEQQQLMVTLKTPFPCSQLKNEIPEDLKKTFVSQHGITHIEIHVTHHVATMECQKPEKMIPGVRNIIAVSSGKGGVGKSTVAFNLALALMQEGARVGLLDADIYGPSIPMMLGATEEKPASPDGKKMLPVNRFGICANSIGFLVDAKDATVWRGPMASKVLQQLLNETQWGEIDYLIVDLPPGTGDIQLTLAQQVPTTAALVVTTPQHIAVADAIKGVSLFEKVQIPILGIIENMSYFHCPSCEHQTDIFGHGGGLSLAQAHQYPLLAQIPLDPRLRHCADEGEPLLILQPEHKQSLIYQQLARQVAAQLFFGGREVPTRLVIQTS